MNFRLYYRGPLSAGRTDRVARKHLIREQFHIQLQELWRHVPLSGAGDVYNDLQAHFSAGGFTFIPLVHERMSLYAELDVLMLAPEEPGKILQRGDLDNRLKTLFDALRVPMGAGEIPKQAVSPSGPFYCLLQDDALIRRVNVDYDRLLAPAEKDEVVLVIRVQVRATTALIGNLVLIT